MAQSELATIAGVHANDNFDSHRKYLKQPGLLSLMKNDESKSLTSMAAS